MNNEVVIMIGAPGCGKSTWGEQYAKDNGFTYLSSDRNRARCGKGEDDQKASARAFALLRLEMSTALDNGENVLVDATFMSRKARKDFVNIGRAKNARIRAVSFELPREIIIERNAKRAAAGGRNVPTFVIDNMLKNYEAPQQPEFDDVVIINEQG
jgi:predicted kinase